MHSWFLLFTLKAGESFKICKKGSMLGVVLRCAAQVIVNFFSLNSNPDGCKKVRSRAAGSHI
jgi:hypothetical protein